MLLIAGILPLLLGCERPIPAAGIQPTIIDGRRFLLELALDESSQKRGLGGRDHIEPNGGMLFIFERSEERRLWMRRCLVPIDVIFLDDGGRVVAMHAMHPEPGVPDEQLRKYSSVWPARYAIELAGGTLRRLNLTNGQKIDLPAATLKQPVR